MEQLRYNKTIKVKAFKRYTYAEAYDAGYVKAAKLIDSYKKSGKQAHITFTCEDFNCIKITITHN